MLGKLRRVGMKALGKPFFLSSFCATIPEFDHPQRPPWAAGIKACAAGNEIAHAARAICAGHSCNVQRGFGVPSRAVFNPSIRFVFTETHLQVCCLYVRFAQYSVCSYRGTSSGMLCGTGRDITAGSKLPTQFRLGAVGNTPFPCEAVWAQHT